MRTTISRRPRSTSELVTPISYFIVSTNDFSTIVNEGCIFFKQEDFENAYEKFTDAVRICGFNSELFYNISLCLFEMKDFKGALSYLDQIIENAY